MQYTPVYVLKGYRVTETYSIGEVIYEAEIEVKTQGWSMGMAGFDPHTVVLGLRTGHHSVGTIRVSFPFTKKTDAVRYVYGDLNRPTFSEEAQQVLAQAVSAFLAEKSLYATINRTLDRFTYEYTT